MRITFHKFMKVKVASSCPTLWPHRLYSPWHFLGQNTGMGGHAFLQGIFPTQGSNPALLHCGQILYHLSHKGSLRILEWVTCPISGRSSQPRNQTRVSSIAGGFFTNWAIREAKSYGSSIFKFWSISILSSIAPRNEQSFSFLSTSSPALVISYFLIIAILTNVKPYLIVVLTYICLIIEDLFMNLLAICMSSLEICLFRGFAQF